MTTFVPVHTDEQIAEVVRLARAIWVEHYVPIIGRAQVEYMLAQYQSAATVQRQLAAGCEYALARRAEESVGYLALVPPDAAGALMLSKIYVTHTARGQGVGQALLGYAQQRAQQLGATTIWLTVNKHNASAIAWYLRQGFINAGALVQDIGGGFVMDDYRMEKRVCPATPC